MKTWQNIAAPKIIHSDFSRKVIFLINETE